MGWTFEDIVEANPRSQSQARSPVERLVEIGAGSPNSLCSLADAVERQGDAFVGVTFQLPFRVGLESSWEQLPSSGDSKFADVRFLPAFLQIDDFGRYRLFEEGTQSFDGEAGLVTVTQVLALFRVWGKRERIHPRYLSALEHGRPDTIVAPQSESWIQNRPITAQAYAQDFTRRLRRETAVMLSRFLPAYSVLSRSEAPTPHRIYGFATMLAAGRVTDIGSAIPLAQHFLTDRISHVTKAVSSADLQAALRHHRQLSRFEAQLFAMDRLSREGEVALSVIGVAALLEWLLGQRLGKKPGKSKLFELIGAPELSCVPPSLLRMADEIRLTRNALVHGAPPNRNLSRAVGDQTVAGRELGELQPVNPAQARAYVEGVFEIYRALNQHDSARAFGTGPAL